MTAKRQRRSRAWLRALELATGLGLGLGVAMAACASGSGAVCDPAQYVHASLIKACAPVANGSREISPANASASLRCTATAYPKPPVGALKVSDFGAVADDDGDDSDAIQRALDTLREGQWLVFAPGVYRHRHALNIARRGVTLWGDGATLQATHALSQALQISADDVSVYRFHLTALTDGRGDQPLQSRIAVYPSNERQRIVGSVIRGNRIVDDASLPGYGNASTAAGIFLFNAMHFRIEDNEVARSLADGIHLTGGSRNGLVTRNRVTQTGDDTIAVVSYLRSAAGVAADADQVARDILIVDNDVGGQYWGRGIAVVGGRSVAIVNNRIRDSAMAASVYVARESYWLTDGISKVLVAGNDIDGNQMTAPVYNYRDTYAPARRTAQGAVEVYTWVWQHETRQPSLRDRLAVRDVALCGNTIARTRTAAIRIGAGAHGAADAVDHTGRRSAFEGGPMQRIRLSANRFMQVPQTVEVHPLLARQVVCTSDHSSAGTLPCPR